jgi:hypothetical protein
VRQSGIQKLGIGMELRLNEAAEKRSGGRAVKAVVVIEDSQPHSNQISIQENLLVSRK